MFIIPLALLYKKINYFYQLVTYVFFNYKDLEIFFFERQVFTKAKLSIRY